MQVKKYNKETLSKLDILQSKALDTLLVLFVSLFCTCGILSCQNHWIKSDATQYFLHVYTATL